MAAWSSRFWSAMSFADARVLATDRLWPSSRMLAMARNNRPAMTANRKSVMQTRPLRTSTGLWRTISFLIFGAVHDADAAGTAEDYTDSLAKAVSCVTKRARDESGGPALFRGERLEALLERQELLAQGSGHRPGRFSIVLV